MTNYCYKFTDDYLKTKNGFQYSKGVAAHPYGDFSAGLCSSGVLHAFRDQLDAFAFRYSCGCLSYGRFWLCTYRGRVLSDRQKIGVERLTLIRELKPNRPTDKQYLRAIDTGIFDNPNVSKKDKRLYKKARKNGAISYSEFENKAVFWAQRAINTDVLSAYRYCRNEGLIP